MAEKKKFKAPEYVYFVFNKGTNAGWGFSTYQDKVGAVLDKDGVGYPGKVVSIYYQLDKNNKPIPYFFSMSMRDRVLKVEKDKTDMYGVSVVEYLRNSPECKGSPNGNYSDVENPDSQTGVFFKEMNEEADARVALDAKDYRRNAENLAAGLSLEEVYEVNALLGQFKKGETFARHYILEVAGNKPDIFMRAYENPQRKALALIKKGISKGILKTQGSVVIWAKTTVGLDELDAAANIQKDKKMIEALEKAVNQVG